MPASGPPRRDWSADRATWVAVRRTAATPTRSGSSAQSAVILQTWVAAQHLARFRRIRRPYRATGGVVAEEAYYAWHQAWSRIQGALTGWDRGVNGAQCSGSPCGCTSWSEDLRERGFQHA